MWQYSQKEAANLLGMNLSALKRYFYGLNVSIIIIIIFINIFYLAWKMAFEKSKKEIYTRKRNNIK